MRIVGVDPGLGATAFAVIEDRGSKWVFVKGGEIQDEGGNLAERLVAYFNAFASFLDQCEPDVVVMEGLFVGKNSKTALLQAHLRGVLLFCCAQKGVQVVEYSPAEVKRAITGKGNATKEQVGYMVSQVFGVEKLPTHLSDALACAWCHTLRSADVIFH